MSQKKRIKDLEKRLRQEGENLPLRVQLAALYREVGQVKKAAEVFLGVALDYYKGRHLEQAREICRIVLDIAPEKKEAVDLLKVVELGLRSGRASSEVDDHAARGDWVPSLAKKRAESSSDADQPPARRRTATDAKTEEKPILTPKAIGKRRAERQLESADDSSRADRDARVQQAVDDSPSLILYTPTPLPAPLAPHDADREDSMPDGLERYKLPIDPDPSEPLPSVTLPANLAPMLDELAGESALADDIDDALAQGAADPTDRMRAQSHRADSFLDEEPTQLTGLADTDDATLDAPNAGRFSTERVPAERPSPAGHERYEDPFPARGSALHIPETIDTESTIRIALPKRLPFLDEPVIGSNPFIDLPERPDGLPVVIHEDMELTDAFIGDFGDSFDQAFDDLHAGHAPEPPAPAEPHTPLAAFSALPAEVLEELAARMTMRHYSADQYILRQEERARACFAIVSGQVSVLRYDPVAPDGGYEELCRLSEGEMFGESCLLPVRYSRGSARAASECDIYEIPRRLLRELAAVHPGVDEILENVYRERLLGSLMAAHPYLRGLDPSRQRELCARFELHHYASGSLLLEEGGASGGLYLVVVGAVEVLKRLSRHRSTLLATVEEGSYLGDMSALTGSSTHVTARAAGPLELAVLPAEAFRSVVESAPGLWDDLLARRGRGALERNYLLTGPGLMI